MLWLNILGKIQHVAHLSKVLFGYNYFILFVLLFCCCKDDRLINFALFLDLLLHP